MVEIEKVNDRVDYIEREKIAKLERDIEEVKLSQVETNTLVKEFSRGIDSQCKTMESMNKALQGMQLEMRDNNSGIKEVNMKLTSFEKATNEEISKMKTDIEKQKLSSWEFMKKNISWIVTVVTILGVVVYETIGKIL